MPLSALRASQTPSIATVPISDGTTGFLALGWLQHPLSTFGALSDGTGVLRNNGAGILSWGAGGPAVPVLTTVDALVRWDATDGSALANSNVTLADSGTALVFSGAGGITATSGTLTFTTGGGDCLVRGGPINQGYDATGSSNMLVLRGQPTAGTGQNAILDFYDASDTGNAAWCAFGLSNGNGWLTAANTVALISSKNGTGTTKGFQITSAISPSSSNWAIHVPANSTRVLIGGTIADDTTTALQINGAFKTAAPSGGTAAVWRVGSLVTAGVTPDLTRYVEVDIGGTLVKLLPCT